MRGYTNEPRLHSMRLTIFLKKDLPGDSLKTKKMADALRDTMLDPRRKYVCRDVLTVIAEHLANSVWQRPPRPDKEGQTPPQVTSSFTVPLVGVWGKPHRAYQLRVQTTAGSPQPRLGISTLDVDLLPLRRLTLLADRPTMCAGLAISDDEGVRVDRSGVVDAGPLSDVEAAMTFLSWVKDHMPYAPTDLNVTPQLATELLADMNTLRAISLPAQFQKDHPVFDALEEFGRNWHRIFYARLYE